MKIEMKQYIYIYIISYATSIFLASYTLILVYHNIQQMAVTQRLSHSEDEPMTNVNKEIYDGRYMYIMYYIKNNYNFVTLHWPSSG